MSTSVSFLKSKAFKEREENARQKLRQAAKQDLVADLSRYARFLFEIQWSNWIIQVMKII